jgi:predicted RNA-binding protein YlxR (DUF448 family)
MRIAIDRQGRLELGRSAPGRGAWVCTRACFDTAAKRGALARALRRELSSTETEALRARLDSVNF